MKINEWKTPSELKRQQQTTSQKPSGGSLEGTILGVLWAIGYEKLPHSHLGTYQQGTENDLSIRDQTANLFCLLVCNFRNFHMSVLVVTHIVNSLDLSLQQSFKN